MRPTRLPGERSSSGGTANSPPRAAVAPARQPLHGKDQVGLKVGAVVNRYTMAKHMGLDIDEATFVFRGAKVESFDPADHRAHRQSTGAQLPNPPPIHSMTG
jgi:hypothetical protein